MTTQENQQKITTLQQMIAMAEANGLPVDDLRRQLNELISSDVNSKTPIYDTLKINAPFPITDEKKKCVEETVEQLLSDAPNAEEPVLLLGKIQCGKTDTFENIIGLAFDKKIDIAVVFTKGTKPLTEQTLMRMKKDYRFFESSDNLRQKATIDIHDIMDIYKRGLKEVNVNNHKTVIVCKKQATNLEHLIDLFQKVNPFLKKKNVLIVDDEADFASRNYTVARLNVKNDREGNPIIQDRELAMAKISQQIDEFRKVPEYCRYLQVTATPYCLYLQPDGLLYLQGDKVMSFKPRFTSLVPIHSKYVGGEEYFVKSQNPCSMYSHLFHSVSQKCIDVLGHADQRYLKSSVSSGNIYGLTTTLVSYFMATVIRKIQRERDGFAYKSSALIHVEISKHNHEWQYKIVERLVNDLKECIVNEDNSDMRILNALECAYNDFQESNRKAIEEKLIISEIPSKEDVMKGMKSLLKNKEYHIQVVNSDEQVVNLLDEKTGELKLQTTANIFIGGNILDRGITIKNMLCFFYGRNPKKFQQDTVLQHARMYGARDKEDMAVTRFHTTDRIYGILARMNELDNQLRQWFIDGKDKTEPNAVFVGYDADIKPCASQKIKVSDTIVLTKQKMFLPKGFWTGSKTKIQGTIDKIDKLILSSPNYKAQDKNGFFTISKSEVVEILTLIESTYVYDDDHNNKERKNDMKELRCALEYCTNTSGDTLLALQRTNREMNRIRENGGWIDAPGDGRTDIQPSRIVAIDKPVIMFIKQKGAARKNELGENIGWNNAPFYWPLFMTQENVEPTMFAINQGDAGLASVIDLSDMLDGINQTEVLSLTFKGDLESAFGKEGTEIESEESRGITKNNASRYLEKDENGEFVIAKKITTINHGVYTYNEGVFPFKLKNYKYMLLRNKRNVHADVMLLELDSVDNWIMNPLFEIEDGNLMDAYNPENILVSVTDTLIDKNGMESDYIEKDICQWQILFKVKRVLKFRKHVSVNMEDEEE